MNADLAEPILVLRPRLWHRLLPFGPLSFALVGLGFIGLSAVGIGISKVGLEQVMMSMANEAALTATLVGTYVALIVLQTLIGMLSRRRISLYLDRLDVTQGRRTASYPRASIAQVTSHIVVPSMSQWLELRLTDGRKARVSGWLMGGQLRRLHRLLTHGDDE